MKHILFVLLLLSLATLGFAQNVGIGTATPDASAKVDIQSTNSGILIPRMTTAQRTVIATPATGLLVFDNTTASFWYYDGSAWIELISDSSLELVDADGDTKVQVEESPDEDIIRFDLAGTEHFVMDGPLLGVKNSGNSVFIGNNAGVNDDQVNNYNVFIGNSAGESNTGGGSNTFIGYAAGKNNVTGIKSTALGYNALTDNDAEGNTAVGFISLFQNTTGVNNTGLGKSAGYGNISGDGNVFVGTLSGASNTAGYHNTFIGYLADASGNFSNAAAIGYKAFVSQSNSLVLGSISGVNGASSTVNVGIGTTAPGERLHVDGGIRIGNTANTVAGNIRWTGSDYEGYDGTAWRSFTADQSILEDADGDTKIQVEESPDEDIIRFDLAGTEHFVMNGPRLEVLNNGESVFIGEGAGSNVTTGTWNTYVGKDAGFNSSLGALNTFIGYNAGKGDVSGTGSNNTMVGAVTGVLNSGSFNSFFGHMAGRVNTTGEKNTFVGQAAAYYNSTGSYNVFMGASAGFNSMTGQSNVFIGEESGYNNDNGNFNVFIGRTSGHSNVTGDNNTFLGNSSGYSNTADNNTFIGYTAGYSNTSGNANSFLGVESGTSTTTGSANTFLGFFSGQTNSTGHDNTFVGASAGRFNTIGHSNAFIGNGAGYNNVDGNFNTYLGRDVGLANTTGNGNTFVGYQAGLSATVGNNNFFGYHAGLNTTTGVSNTFLGNVSGHANTTGHDNAFVGSASGRNNTTGHSNVFIGPGAGYQNQTGNFNVYLGRDAGLTGTTGTHNVFLGFRAGYNESGNNKLYIESSTSSSPLIYGEFDNDIVAVNGSLGVGDVSPAADFTVGNGDKFQVDGTNGDVLFTDDQASITFPAATASAAPMIQMFASGTANPDRMVLAHSSSFTSYGLQYQDTDDQFHFLRGGYAVMTVDLGPSRSVGIRQPNPTYDLHLGFNSAAKPTSNTWTVPSDARLKKDVHDFEDGLVEILKIRPVTYTYTGEAGLPQETGVGIIAQELKEVAPYMVSTWTHEGEEADRQEYYAVDNGAMTYMLINAIQEQQKLIEQLQEQVEDLRNDR